MIYELLVPSLVMLGISSQLLYVKQIVPARERQAEVNARIRERLDVMIRERLAGAS